MLIAIVSLNFEDFFLLLRFVRSLHRLMLLQIFIGRNNARYCRHKIKSYLTLCLNNKQQAKLHKKNKTRINFHSLSR